jgi:hypothetical protein
MMLESNGCHVEDIHLWCWRVAVMVLESNGYGVKRVTFMVLARNGSRVSV